MFDFSCRRASTVPYLSSRHQTSKDKQKRSDASNTGQRASSVCFHSTLSMIRLRSARRSPPSCSRYKGCCRGVRHGQEPLPKRWRVLPFWRRSSRRRRHGAWYTARPGGRPLGVELLRRSPPWAGGVRRGGFPRKVAHILQLSFPITHLHLDQPPSSNYLLAASCLNRKIW